jgi:putative transposase
VLLSVVYAIFRLFVDALLSRRHRDRDVELLVLRHQLNVLQRTAGPPRWQAGDRFLLAALSRQLPRAAWRSLLVNPETVLRWHRQLVRRKWAAFGRRGSLGRRPVPTELRELVIRLAWENPTWGYLRIKGELRKLGHALSASTIRRLLRKRCLPPAPRRGGLDWGEFIRAHAGTLMACDFFFIELARPALPGSDSHQHVAAEPGCLGGWTHMLQDVTSSRRVAQALDVCHRDHCYRPGHGERQPHDKPGAEPMLPQHGIGDH